MVVPFRVVFVLVGIFRIFFKITLDGRAHCVILVVVRIVQVLRYIDAFSNR